MDDKKKKDLVHLAVQQQTEIKIKDICTYVVLSVLLHVGKQENPEDE